MKKIVSVTGALILAATISSSAFAGKLGEGTPFWASRGSFQGNTSMPNAPMSTGQANSTGFMNGRQANGQNGQMGGRTNDQMGTHANGQTGGRMM